MFSYPWAGSGERRRYLLGCLKAFLKSGFERKFYDLGKVGYWGPQSKKKSTSTSTQPAPPHPRRPANGSPQPTARARPEPGFPVSPLACGGTRDQLSEPHIAVSALACGGGTDQMTEEMAEGMPEHEGNVRDQ